MKKYLDTYPSQLANKSVSTEEVKAYFGLLYLFGLVCKTAYTEHWSKNPLVYNPLPAEIMPINKFALIKSMLCLYDPWTKQTLKNPIRKILFMID